MNHYLLIYGGACFASAVLLLVAIWTGVSKKHWFVRAAVAYAALAVLYPIRALQPMIWFALAMPPMALISWSVWRLSEPKAVRSDHQTTQRGQRLQFRLTDCMLLVLLAGGVLAFSVALRDQETGFDWHLGAIVCCCTFVAVLCLIVTVTRGWWRILPLLGLLLAIGLFAELYAQKLYTGYPLLVAGYVYLFPEQLRMEAAMFYGALAGMVFFGLFVRWSMSPVAAGATPLRKRVTLLARLVSVLSLLVVLPAALVVYVGMLHGPPTPPIAYEGQPNSFASVKGIVDEITRMNPNGLPLTDYRSSTTAKQAKRLEQLQSELILHLDAPGYIPVDVGKDTYFDAMTYSLNARAAARMLNAEANAALQAGRITKASEYSLASIRFGSLLSRGGLLNDWIVGILIEEHGNRTLVRLRDRLTPVQSKSLLRALQQIDASRESVQMTLARDEAFHDRWYKWSARLPIAAKWLLGKNPSAWLMNLQDLQRFRDAELRLLITDLAMRCYRSEHGRVPDDLTLLIPEYFDAVPIDPYSGNPVIYRVSEPGKWTVYSVGRDGKDDGGVFAPNKKTDEGPDLDLNTTPRNW